VVEQRLPFVVHVAHDRRHFNVNNHSNKADHKHVTMRDVARRAGVSLATVSYVLNPGTRPVSAARRERVLAVIAELGYEPAPRPRARTRVLTIGLVVPDATNPFFSRSVVGVDSVLKGSGHLMLCSSSGEDLAREQELIAALLKRRVDGLILTPVGKVSTRVERLVEDGFPVVIMDRAGSHRLNRVTMNNYESAFQATRLLIQSGHTAIALVNGPEHVDTAGERRRGYREALRFAGLAGRAEHERSGPFTFDHGRQATRELLSLPDPPTAIFSSSAILTSGVLWALRERRLHWPDDIAVVGFGDAVWASLVTPPLTVIEQPVEQIGETAAQMLLAAITRRAPAAGQHVVLDSHLVLRESHWRVDRDHGARRESGGPD
jgi:LacI family transcriptional regulator